MSQAGRTGIYRGRLVDLGLEPVVLPGGEAITLEIVRHPGGAVILALDEQERVCLLRQFRHAAGGWIWELPAGVIEPGEKPIETAKRELREETGLEAADWKPLGSTLPSPGFCSEELFLFRATGLTDIGARPDADEQIEVHYKPFPQVQKMAVDGSIRDAKTIIAIYRATHRF